MEKGGGNWVDRENFFNREAEPNGLMERVREGTHALCCLPSGEWARQASFGNCNADWLTAETSRLPSLILRRPTIHPTRLLKSGSVAGLSTDRKVHAGAKKSVRHKAGHDT